MPERVPSSASRPLRRIGTLASRALRLRCPSCGESPVFRTWFHTHDHCPACGLHFDRREPGYVVGSYMFNIIAAELIFAAIFVGVLVATWPDAPWTLLQYGGAALMILLPVLFYPFAKTIFLAFDLVFRPAGSEDQP